jgi:serine/threonine protein kinase
VELTEGIVVAGRFRLVQLIGQGGMGSVWRAHHLGLDIPCAVKFIEGTQAQLPEPQTRFKREATAAAQLRSPHVVQIMDHGVFEDTPYMAMELLEGEDLGKRLARVGRMPPADFCRILAQVCRALSKAHSLGIVHRDIKPDNIFLVRDDDREIAKVLDFGIAKQHIEGLAGGNTRTGAILGTPYYMSPEQGQGTKAVDGRSDLWSLAVIAFQALTGRLPFESDGLGDLLLKIIVRDLPIPSQIAAVPPGFDAWWLKAASRDPAGRFQSAKELSESLNLVCHVSSDGRGFDHEASAMGVRAPSMPTEMTGVPATALGQKAYTPSPTSNTLANATNAGTQRAPIGLIAGFAATVLLATGGVFLLLHSRGGTETHVAANEGAPAASSAPAAASSPAASTATPTAAPPAPSATVASTPTPPTPTVTPTVTPGPSPTSHAKPATPKPSGPAKPAQPDMGF